jgi:hypothetical protein
MAPPSMVMYINSSNFNNILYAIWYDMLNIANNGAAEYGIILKVWVHREQRRNNEASGGVMTKAAAARQGRQQRRGNEGSGSATRKAEPVARR